MQGNYFLGQSAYETPLDKGYTRVFLILLMAVKVFFFFLVFYLKIVLYIQLTKVSLKIIFVLKFKAIYH